MLICGSVSRLPRGAGQETEPSWTLLLGKVVSSGVLPEQG